MQELQMRQALPLSMKIAMTKTRIRDWVNEFGENVESINAEDTMIKQKFKGVNNDYINEKKTRRNLKKISC